MLRASANGIPLRSANLLRRQASLGRWSDRTSLGRYVRRARRTPVSARVPKRKAGLLASAQISMGARLNRSLCQLKHQCFRRGRVQTRTVSLGIGPMRPSQGADQEVRGSVSTRDYPLATLPNCTLIARRRADLGWSCPSWSSPVLLVAAIPQAAAAVSRLAQRARSGLGLDSADSAETMTVEERRHVQPRTRRLSGMDHHHLRQGVMRSILTSLRPRCW